MQRNVGAATGLVRRANTPSSSARRFDASFRSFLPQPQAPGKWRVQQTLSGHELPHAPSSPGVASAERAAQLSRVIVPAVWDGLAPGGFESVPLLAVNEQAERVVCRVEHDPKPRAVAVSWLMRGLGASPPDNASNGRVEVVHEDFEVHHLRLMPW